MAATWRSQLRRILGFAAEAPNGCVRVVGIFRGCSILTVWVRICTLGHDPFHMGFGGMPEVRQQPQLQPGCLEEVLNYPNRQLVDAPWLNSRCADALTSMRMMLWLPRENDARYRSCHTGCGQRPCGSVSTQRRSGDFRVSSAGVGVGENPGCGWPAQRFSSFLGPAGNAPGDLRDSEAAPG
jgi:hypothetical protein